MADRHFIELSAGRFSYLELGQGEAVVFLHALGRDGSDWLPVMGAMKSNWRCVAMDQRGHGDSVRPGEYRVELMGGDFAEFVDALGLARFVLVAHSMGGTVAWSFAKENPDRLGALIIEDSVVPIPEHEYPDIPESPPEPVGYDWEARRQLFRQLSSPELSWSTDLERITTSTLVIASSENRDELARTVRLLPRAELVTIDVGHWIHESAPEEFVDTVSSFLARDS